MSDTPKHNDVINALKRLERAGDAASETNRKLIEAARVLLRAITERVAAQGDDPSQLVCPDPDCWYIPVAATEWLPDNWTLAVYGSHLGGMRTGRYDGVDRERAILLGEAVAGGLMAGLAEWAEGRVQAAASATRIMERASQEAS